MTLVLSADDRNFVFAVIRRMLRCEHAANDATQDALLSAYRHYAKFRGDSALRTWLYRIAVHTALGHLRRRRRSREDFVDDLALDTSRLVDSAPRPDELADLREQLAHATASIVELKRDQRLVLALRLADYTESEIAEQLGISIANVKIRAHRARTHLRAA
jgi:RNA polymerase sigma-70 factor (ECF subfamily)